MVLEYISEQRLYSLLQNKLFIETALRSTIDNRTKQTLAPIFDVQRSMVGLKLPSALPKDTIKKDTNELSPQDLNEWKTFLEQVNKKKDV